MADVGRVVVDPLEQPAPQLGLPAQVVVERFTGTVGVAALAPVGDQGRPLHGVRPEQAGEPPGNGVAPVASELCLVTVEAVAEVGRQGGAPGLAEAVVDRGEQRPDQVVGVPGVVAVAVEQHRDQRVRAEEPDAGAHPVPAARPDAQPMAEPLGQPALHALRRHHHDLLGERVVEGRGHQLAERVGELVGARCAVEMEGHRWRG